MIHTHLNPGTDLCLLKVRVCFKKEAVFIQHVISKIAEGLIVFLSHLVQLNSDIFPSGGHEVDFETSEEITEI